jgi:hypothetical protein
MEVVNHTHSKESTMKNHITTFVSLCLLACLCVADTDYGPAPAKGSSKAGLTIQKASGKVNWKSSKSCKATPYGYGSFSLKMSTPTGITDLSTLAQRQSGYFGFTETASVSASTGVYWTTKFSSTSRTYIYSGNNGTVRFFYKVVMKLKNGMLYVKIIARNRDYVASLYNLSDTTSSGTHTLTANLVLVDEGGVPAQSCSCWTTLEYNNIAGKKSTAKLQQ